MFLKVALFHLLRLSSIIKDTRSWLGCGSDGWNLSVVPFRTDLSVECKPLYCIHWFPWFCRHNSFTSVEDLPMADPKTCKHDFKLVTKLRWDLRFLRLWILRLQSSGCKTVYSGTWVPTFRGTLKMEATSSSKMFEHIYQTTLPYHKQQ